MLELAIDTIVVYFEENVLSILWKVLLSFIVFLGFFIVARKIVAKVRRNIESKSLTDDVYTKRVSKLIGSIVFLVIMIFAVLAVFQVIGFDVAILMGGVSIGIGFAMETTIKNMIAGVMILFHKKIKLGEIIQLLGTLKLLGTVEEINIRYTVIKTFDKRRVIIPNSTLVNTPIQTLKTEPLLRGQVDFTLPRHVFVPQVRELILGAIREHEFVVRPEYASVLINGFNDSGIQITGFFFTDPQKKTPFLVTRELNLQLFEIFKKYGIDIPYSHTTVTV